MSPSCNKSFRDDVYADGKLQRVDRTFFSSGVKKLIGVNGGYRPPYGGKVFSLYYFQPPSPEVLAEYGCSRSMYKDSIRNWYGVKYDFENNRRSAKFVFDDNSCLNSHPDINADRALFYARIHGLDGSVSPWVDMYFVATPSYVQDWCNDQNICYPVPYSVDARPWCFSAVWNEDTGQIRAMKAYVRHWKRP